MAHLPETGFDPWHEKGAEEIMMKPPSSPPLSDALRQGLEKLSEGQVDCLRLAGNRLKTKEIAEILDMSPGRVDKQILAARQKLGGLSRVDAGLLVLAWEEVSSPLAKRGYSLGAQTMSLPPAINIAPTAAVDQHADAPAPAIGTCADRQETYLLSPAAPDRFALVSLRHSGRPANDLNSQTTLATIAKLMIGALVAVGSALSLLVSLTQLTQH